MTDGHEAAEPDALAQRAGPQALEAPPKSGERHESAKSTAGDDAVIRVARSRPFMSTFVACAHDRYSETWPASERVRRMISDHRGWYRSAWWADYLTLALGILLLIAVGASALYKTFWT